MSEEKDNFMIDLRVTIEYSGEEIPDEEYFILPIKQFIKKSLKAYKKTARIVAIKTGIYTVGFEECADGEL